MSVMDKVRNIAMTVLDPHFHDKDVELRYLRELNESKATPSAKPRTAYRIFDQFGEWRGYSYCCECGTEYEFHSPEDVYTTHKCGCGHDFNILKAAGVPSQCPPQKVIEYLTKLAIRPRIGGAPRRPNVMDIWPKDDGIQYTGSAAGNDDDPFAGGPGFSSPR
jgi:hypothetical protein